MTRLIAVVLVGIAVVGAERAYAQETPAGPGVIEVTIIPGTGVFFTGATEAQEPSFGNYNLGGAVAYNFNRFFGLEGEVASTLGISQDLDFGFANDHRTPDMLTYSGNAVLSFPSSSSVVPYVTGGVGGLTVLEKADFGIPESQTLFTGNAGGGLKWIAGRWGLRGDYRFIAVQSQDDAPVFFGQETRYGHRVYGAVTLNLGR